MSKTCKHIKSHHNTLPTWHDEHATHNLNCSGVYFSGVRKWIVSVIGRMKTLKPSFLKTLIPTLRTLLSLLGKTWLTRPIAHSFLFRWSSFRRTMLPCSRSGSLESHFLLVCKRARYCFFHVSQKLWAKCCTQHYCCLWRFFAQSPTGAGVIVTFFFSKLCWMWVRMGRLGQ